MVDKNLFLNDLAVVAILKDEGPYIKEWLDYHLLAGVEHFYLYNNDSSDNYAEIIAPYVKAGVVTSTDIPGKLALGPAYHDALKRFKFFNRYMAFIDLDEFIYPKTGGGGGIVSLVDEILAPIPAAKGLSIHWQEFGSNGHDKADYSHGVLERFTRRAKKDFYGTFKDSNGIVHTLGNAHLKIITNPRYVKRQGGPHFVNYFEGFHTVDERGGSIPPTHATLPVVADKIAINHYRCKSKEEFVNKLRRGSPTNYPISSELFEHFDNNDEFDDGILKYRDERAKNFKMPNSSQADERLFNALSANLFPTFVSRTSSNFYANRMETFLTCRAVAAYLQTRLMDNSPAKFFEELSLKAILKSFNAMNFADVRLLLNDLPNLLSLPYPVVKDLRDACLNIIPQVINTMRLNKMWVDFEEMSYLKDLLKFI